MTDEVQNQVRESKPLPTLCPNDHLKLMVELLKEGGVELTRRWVAALVMVSPEDREQLVEALEKSVTELYDMPVTLLPPQKHSTAKS